ncbi:hypothetical protein PMIT1323_01888 [Prochlorococcus marinus str. MIT 1323]|nr:hypothetical protein PMIT1323_01888 [Prochlorococcus marinus str. MIT 1323]
MGVITSDELSAEGREGELPDQSLRAYDSCRQR